MGRQVAMKFRTWGGKRDGAGRSPAGARAGVSHASRAPLVARFPQHVNVRVMPDLYGLRGTAGYSAIQWALSRQARRHDFRVCQVSIQRTHVHLLVEADGAEAMSRGMQGLLVAAARHLNATRRRRGRVFADRYHATALRTPRQVRNALSYVLNNWRKHGADARTSLRLDPYSSAIGFTPWATRKVLVTGVGLRFPAGGALPVAYPDTWLLREGWLRGGGAISWFAVPRQM